MPRFKPLFTLKDKMARNGIRIDDLVKATGYEYNYVSQVLNGHEKSGTACDKLRESMGEILKGRKTA